MWKFVPAATGWPEAQPPELTISFPEDSDTLVLGRDILSTEGIINKRISRAQVTLKRHANRTVTAELSGLNPSFINDTKIEKGQVVEVKAGDVVKLLPDFAHFTAVKTEPKPESVDTEEDEPLAAPGPKRRLQDDDVAPPKRARSVKEELPIPLARQPSVASMERSNSLRILEEREEKEAKAVAEMQSSAEKKQAENLAKLSEEMTELKKLCGAGCFFDQTNPSQCFVVRMPLDTSFMDKYQLKAVGIQSKPIIIQLKFDAEFLHGHEIPTLFTFQSEDKALDSPSLKDYDTEYGAMQYYVETRITSVLRKNWTVKPAAPVAAAVSPAAGEFIVSLSLASALFYNTNDNYLQGNRLAAVKDEPEVNEASVAELMQMGFKRPDVEMALRKAANKTEDAVNMLLNGTFKDAPASPVAAVKKEEAKKDPKVTELMKLGFTEQEAKNGLEMFNGDIKLVTENLLDTIQARIESEDKKGNKKRGRKSSPPAEEDDPLKPSARELLWPKDNRPGFLANFYKFMTEKFIMCSARCLICDADLNVALTKLPVCSDAACQRIYQTTATGPNAIANEIRNNSEVVDLLLNLLMCVSSGNNVKGWNRGGMGLAAGGAKKGGYGAAYHNFGKANVSFEPFPWGVGLDDGKTQHLDALQETLDLIPPIAELKKYGTDEALKMYLNDINPHCFGLLRWVIQSNRTQLALIPAKNQIKEMKTPLQFQIVNTFPEHEKRYIEWKERAVKENRDSSGSYKAFHGSPITNWHSIIRTGLRSGFVPGIYMAADAAVSLGYMAVGQSKAQGWANSQWKFNEKISAISLLEVADMRHKPNLITGGVQAEQGGVNVAMENSLVITRFIFFYPMGPSFIPNAANGAVGWWSPANPGPRACNIRTDEAMFRSDSM